MTTHEFRNKNDTEVVHYGLIILLFLNTEPLNTEHSNQANAAARRSTPVRKVA